MTMSHLIVVPVLLPLVTAAFMLLFSEKRRRFKTAVSLVSSLAGLGVAVSLLLWVDGNGPQAMGVYLPSNWPAPYGIVLVADRLTAMMLVLTSLVGLGAVSFSGAGWFRVGVHFHPLLQLQFMGLNGAFLTGDLFNLFVFFEVMLAASYGLLLHGSGRARVRSGLHYIAINLLASSLFLVGAALLYGVTGTLNLADLASRVPLVSPADRSLLHAGAAILAVAFLAKAAIWPLNFWLVPAYAAASAPVGAFFAIMTKVGIYAVLRLWTLFFGPDAQASAHFGAEVLAVGGLLTIGFGALGLLRSQRLGRVAAYCVMVSSGTLLTAIAFGIEALTAGALFYLASSTLGASVLFLLVELIERAGQGDPIAQAAPLPEDLLSGNLDDEEEPLFGRVIPAAVAFLGVSFILAALVLVGMPPLSGFVGKVAMLQPLLDSDAGRIGWTWFALLFLSGFASLFALVRAGIKHFWTDPDRPPPRLKVVEGAPVAGLILVCVALTFKAGPALRYTGDAARGLLEPRGYIEAVLLAMPKEAPR